MTQPACCARQQAQLTRERADVNRLARIMSGRFARGRPVDAYRTQLAEAKEAVARRHLAMIDHEAAHAEEGAA